MTAGEMISFGAGVNSVAMAIMLAEGGWRGPIVFADTGAEWPETYCYMRYFEAEYLRPRGLSIVRLAPATNPDLYADKRIGGPDGVETLEAYCLAHGVIPLLAVRWCTVEFKRKPLEKWRRARGIERSLLGISASEPRRIHDDPKVRYPLWEDGATRGECRRIIEAAGLAQPTKSGCFFCPGQNLTNWRRLYYEHPDLYERAIALEDNASACGQKWATLDAHGTSLRQHARQRWVGQETMDLSAWLPCLCSL